MGKAVSVDAAIAGGGIIGLSLGLELLGRGVSVAVIERGRAMGQASCAAAGMLAVDDPQNPPLLLPLAQRSWALYPEYLARVEQLSGLPVPLRTHRALQYVPAAEATGLLSTDAEIAALAPGLRAGGTSFLWLNEASLDPLDLCAALPRAFVAAGGLLLEEREVLGVVSDPAVSIRTSQGAVSAAIFINCCGAWAGAAATGQVPVSPVKGQMLNLHCPPELLRCAVRAPHVYLVPRGDGRVAVGSTIEHAGFDRTVVPETIESLAQAARRLLPEAAAVTQSWAGLRPGTPDGLPILGPAEQPHCWHATGHYRDGILLAPATARLMSQAILGEATDIPLAPYSARRFE